MTIPRLPTVAITAAATLRPADQAAVSAASAASPMLLFEATDTDSPASTSDYRLFPLLRSGETSASEASDSHLPLEPPMLSLPPRASIPSNSISKHSHRIAKGTAALRNEFGPKLVIVMCGLPARGKSCKFYLLSNKYVFKIAKLNATNYCTCHCIDICKKLSKYLSWCGFKTKVFNVGNRRRVNAPPLSAQSESLKIEYALDSPSRSSNRISTPAPKSANADGASPVIINRPGTLHDSSFFDPKNKQYAATREKIAMDTLDELLYWLVHEDGKVAIHDATNSTVERRRAVVERVSSEEGISVVFVESICTDMEVLEQNILMKLKGPDYINMPPDEAIADFRERMKNYEKVYETISEDEENNGISYIKIINVGKKVIAHNIHGYLASQCVFYLMQIHIKERTLWLSRHGESTYNRVNRIGGDPPLTPLGKRYARAMNDFIKKDIIPPHLDPVNDAEEISRRRQGVHVWTSTLQRTLGSIEGFEEDDWHVVHFKLSNFIEAMALGEIFAGICEDMTLEEIEGTYPEVWAELTKNKLNYRYPGSGGESYNDVIDRIRPLIVELERMEDNLVIITHQVILRTLLAYFGNCSLEEMPTTNIPLHVLYKVCPKPYGADVSVYKWNEETDEMELIGGNELLDSERGNEFSV
ncbi:hypothetical protein HDU82_002873 [Entophlyctis luteolus]|nr:hypothetical protein HDU82_002873 [Entophlyctis luteolus]